MKLEQKVCWERRWTELERAKGIDLYFLGKRVSSKASEQSPTSGKGISFKTPDIVISGVTLTNLLNEIPL